MLGRIPHPLEKGKSILHFCSLCLWAPCDLDSLGIVCDGAGLGPPAECEGWNDGGVVAQTIGREGGREGGRKKGRKKLALAHCKTAIKPEEGFFWFAFSLF